ncbi:hypothetical protein CVS40_2526 [Lucilia cuprina]|nr:hypothetical protein CVS40_2526 [Lucilia cuprina]
MYFTEIGCLESQILQDPLKSLIPRALDLNQGVKISTTTPSLLVLEMFGFLPLHNNIPKVLPGKRVGPKRAWKHLMESRRMGCKCTAILLAHPC